MDFPVSIPWETLDPEILQKAINSGSNYRTYCDEKSWDISFEIEFLEKEEIQKQVKVLENQSSFFSWLSTDAAKAELLRKRQMNERKLPNIQKKNRQKW